MSKAPMAKFNPEIFFDEMKSDDICYPFHIFVSKPHQGVIDGMMPCISPKLWISTERQINQESLLQIAREESLQEALQKELSMLAPRGAKEAPKFIQVAVVPNQSRILVVGSVGDRIEDSVATWLYGQGGGVVSIFSPPSNTSDKYFTRTPEGFFRPSEIKKCLGKGHGHIVIPSDRMRIVRQVSERISESKTVLARSVDGDLDRYISVQNVTEALDNLRTSLSGIIVDTMF